MDAKDQAMIQGMDRLGFKLVGAMARIFGSLAAKDEETYWYGIRSADGNGFVDLTAVIGNTDTASVEITQEADFVGTRILMMSVNPTTGAILAPQVAGGPSFTVTIRDGSSDRQLVQYPIHAELVAGTAQRSVPFTKNRLFRRNSTVFFDYVNLQAVATRIYMAIQGFKVFDESALDLVRRR